MQHRYIVWLWAVSPLFLMPGLGCGNDAHEQRVYTERTYIQVEDTAQSDAAASDTALTPPDRPGGE